MILLPRAFTLRHPWTLLWLAACALGVVGCSSTPPYHYTYIPGRTATLTADGQATTPPRAPRSVAAAIAAGNEIVGSPYVYGGGHGLGSGGFDCSGSVSYVLRAAGRLRGSMPSQGFRRYGERGTGRWINVYARSGHVFVVVAGLRLDTGYNGEHHAGPRWTTRDRPADEYVIRHPEGL